MYYDYSIEELGVYFPSKKYNIYINPILCKNYDDVENNNNLTDPFCPGYCADLTIFGITIHEFCHLLQMAVYKTIVDDYIKAFPTNRFYLNTYCDNEIYDELAEIMTLYIINPYLLKLISNEHYKFCMKYFKSPIPCSSAKCYFIYDGFPIIVKEHLKNHWKIVYDLDKNNFVKIT
jgi:hypothetical protein